MSDMPEDILKAAREVGLRIGYHGAVLDIAAAILAEREQCAEIADVIADEKDVMALSCCTDDQVASYREGERTAKQIASAIRDHSGREK